VVTEGDGPLRDPVSCFAGHVGHLIEEEVEWTEARPGQVPVPVFGEKAEGHEVGQRGVEQRGDLLGGVIGHDG